MEDPEVREFYRIQREQHQKKRANGYQPDPSDHPGQRRPPGDDKKIRTSIKSS